MANKIAVEWRTPYVKLWRESAFEDLLGLRNARGLSIQDRLGNWLSRKSRLCSGILPRSGAGNCVWLALLFGAVANIFGLDSR